MATKQSFGDFFKELRLRQGQTLREFCSANNFNPGNISKLERGILPPPQSDEKLAEYALALGIKKASSDWFEFFDLAAAGAGTIPSDIRENSEIVHRLPAFFRTLRDKKLSVEKLDALIKRIKVS